MTPQDQANFEIVVAHLLAQGGPAKSNHGQCVYRGAEGRKCAIGCLIPDDLYVPEMEGRGVSRLFEQFPSVAGIFSRENLASDLQGVHDVCSTYINRSGADLVELFHISNLKKNLRRIAEKYGLKVPASIKTDVP